MDSAREKRLEAAGHRSYSDGIAGTGISTIIAEAGVAKMSLYNNFASKDELVITYLEERHDGWRGFLDTHLEAAFDPRGRILAVFDACIDHAALASEQGFRSCGGLNGAAELPVGHPGRDAVRRHKEDVHEILFDTCVQAGLEDPSRTAEHLFLLVEGGVVSAGLVETSEHLQRAREAGSELVVQEPDRVGR